MAPFAIILYSGSTDRWHEALSFATGAAAQGKTVLLFLRGPALKAFVSDQWAESPGIPGLKAGVDQALTEAFSQVRSRSKVRVYACSAWVRLWGLEAPAVASRVDAVIGLNGFLSQAEGGALLYL
jgi:peroxiredoxin family protein